MDIFIAQPLDVTCVCFIAVACRPLCVHAQTGDIYVRRSWKPEVKSLRTGHIVLLMMEWRWSLARQCGAAARREAHGCVGTDNSGGVNLRNCGDGFSWPGVLVFRRIPGCLSCLVSRRGKQWDVYLHCKFPCVGLLICKRGNAVAKHYFNLQNTFRDPISFDQILSILSRARACLPYI